MKTGFYGLVFITVPTLLDIVFLLLSPNSVQRIIQWTQSRRCPETLLRTHGHCLDPLSLVLEPAAAKPPLDQWMTHLVSLLCLVIFSKGMSEVVEKCLAYSLNLPVHCGPEQPKIHTEVLGHSLAPHYSLRSLGLLRSFTRSLCSLSCSLDSD